MDNDWIFYETDYRKVIRKKLETDGHQRGYRTQLAQAAGCQLAYISHVLDNLADLTPDQAAGVCEFWSLGDLETEYFIGLVHLGRSHTPRLKARIERQLQKLRTEHSQTRKNRLSHESYDPEKVIDYFREWAIAATHAFLSTPLARDLKQLSVRLQIEENRLNQYLFLLAELGFIQKENHQWKATSKYFHAADENRFAHLHHLNWRRKAELDIQRINRSPESFHYTALYSLSKKNFQEIRMLLANTVTQTRKIVSPSPEETVGCFLMDWWEL